MFTGALGSAYADGLVRSVLRLADDLEPEVFESADQVRRAVDVGATRGQGLWFGPVLPLDQFEAWHLSLQAGLSSKRGHWPRR